VYEFPHSKDESWSVEKPVDNMVIKIGLNVDLFALSGRLS